VSVCLSASISLEPLDQLARNFVHRSPVAVAQSSVRGIAIIRYVLLVLWMTSPLAVMGATPEGGGCIQQCRSITCVTGVESDVNECLFLVCDLGLLVGLCTQDYKSLCAAVTICTILVNIWTHTQTAFDQLI